jgi:hypothetical protein
MKEVCPTCGGKGVVRDCWGNQDRCPNRYCRRGGIDPAVLVIPCGTCGGYGFVRGRHGTRHPCPETACTNGYILVEKALETHLPAAEKGAG